MHLLARCVGAKGVAVGALMGKFRVLVGCMCSQDGNGGSGRDALRGGQSLESRLKVGDQGKQENSGGEKHDSGAHEAPAPVAEGDGTELAKAAGEGKTLFCMCLRVKHLPWILLHVSEQCTLYVYLASISHQVGHGIMEVQDAMASPCAEAIDQSHHNLKNALDALDEEMYLARKAMPRPEGKGKGKGKGREKACEA